MLKKSILSIVLLVAVSSVSAQAYFAYLRNGEKAFEAKDYNVNIVVIHKIIRQLI